MVSLGRITLLDDDLYDVLPLEDLVGNDGHIDDGDLYWEKITSSLLTKSTGGLIFSTKTLMKRRNSSCSLRESSNPITSPFLS
jgi:hypothetical protein